jgi:hypothetical protein
VSHANLSPSVLLRNRQTEDCLVLRSKPRNRHGDFEVQIIKPKLPVLRSKSPNHEIIKRDSPNEIKIKEKQNKTVMDSNSNLTKSMTHHNQTKELTTWFLNLPLDESIDNKSIKFKVRIQDPMKHS